MTFGDFVALRPIATSSLATLYVGRRTSARGFVQLAALNILHPQFAHDRELVAVLGDACRRAACIDHPNVCRVCEAGEANETFYVATQYLFGETLASVLEVGRRADAQLPCELLCYVIAQTCEGLHAAHSALDARGAPLHLVHGGLSPHRLHLTYQGSAHVRDFGMLEAIERVQLGRGDLWRARFAYLAPEQIRGEEPDPSADLWSLGVILRESLCGRPLFPGQSAAQIIHTVLNEPLPAWPVHVPRALRGVCERAMERNPRDRYANASAMSAELRRFFADGHEAEANLASWMRARFDARVQEKGALLRALSEQSSLRSIPAPHSAEGEACEEPTRAWFDDEPIAADCDAEPDDATEESGARSHVRLAASGKLPAPPRVPETTIWPPPARARVANALARHPIAFALMMLVVGAVLGCAFSKAFSWFRSRPSSLAAPREVDASKQKRIDNGS